MKPDLTKKIDYTYTPTPTNLMIALDVNCRSMLFTLCQLHSYYANEDGIFFRTNSDLSSESQLSQKLVIATIDTLYIHGIIEVWSVGKGKGKECNKYRLNLNKFKEYEQYSMDDLKNPELQIETIKEYNRKGYTPQYLKDNKDNEMQIEIHKNRINLSQEIQNISPNLPQITNNKDNIDNEENINNKEIIDNEDNKDNKDNKKNEEDIENEYYNKLKRLFKEYGSNYQLIFNFLAKYDYDCFIFLVNLMKNNKDLAKEYSQYYNIIHELRYKYGN